MCRERISRPNTPQQHSDQQTQRPKGQQHQSKVNVLCRRSKAGQQIHGPHRRQPRRRVEEPRRGCPARLSPVIHDRRDSVKGDAQSPSGAGNKRIGHAPQQAKGRQQVGHNSERKAEGRRAPRFRPQSQAKLEPGQGQPRQRVFGGTGRPRDDEPAQVSEERPRSKSQPRRQPDKSRAAEHPGREGIQRNDDQQADNGPDFAHAPAAQQQ